MLKKIKTIKFPIVAVVLILLLGITLLKLDLLKAQPGGPVGGFYIENQMLAPQDANFSIKGVGIFGRNDSNQIYLDPAAAAVDQNSLYVNNSSADGNFIKLSQNGQEKFEVDKEGAIWQDDVKMFWCNGTCPTWTP